MNYTISLIIALLVCLSVQASAEYKRFNDELAKLPSSINNIAVLNKYIDLISELGEQNPESALKISNRIIGIAKHLNYPEGVNNTLIARANLELMMNKQDQALMTYMLALKEYRQSGNSRKIAELLSQIAKVYHRKSNNTVALEYLREALKIAKQINDWSRLAHVQNNMAIIYFDNGEYDKALNLFRESQATSELAKDSLAIANTYIGIGNVNFEINNLQQAINSYRTAIEIFEKHSNTQKPLSIAYTNLAEVYQLTGNRDSALYYFNLCYNTAVKLHDPISQALALQNLSQEYLQKNDYIKAIKYADLALIEYTKMQNYLEIATVNILKSRIYKKSSEYEQAIIYALNAEKSAKKHKLVVPQLKSIEELAELYYLNGDYRNAANYYRIKNKFNDSLQGSQNYKSLQSKIQQYQLKLKGKQQDLLQKEIDIKKLIDSQNLVWSFIYLIIVCVVILGIAFYYNFRKKEKVILSQINKQNEIIDEKNIQIIEKGKQIEAQIELLKSETASKEKLFSVIAHDLKNPLTIIMTSADIAYSYFDKLSVEQQKNYLEKISNASYRMNGLLHNLLDWVMSQQGKIVPVKQKVLVDEVVHSALAIVSANSEAKNIKIKYIDNSELTIYVDSNMLKTVLRNILSNAVKYSHPDSEINIKAHRVKYSESTGGDLSKIHIIIEDYGVGIEADKLGSLFKSVKYNSYQGQKSEKGTGLGLIISKDFVNKNNGKLEIESKFGEGTKVTLILPEISY